MGVVIENGTFKPSPRKVAALAQTSAPTDLKGVRQFLGLAGYFRRFVKNFASLTATISALIRIEKVFKWTNECEKVRIHSVKGLIEYPI